nr:hypothetical protein [Staphylococcus epidermidis]
MDEKIFTVLAALFSMLLILSNDILAESKQNMNMTEDKQKQNDEMDMGGHDERKNLILHKEKMK